MDQQNLRFCLIAVYNKVWRGNRISLCGAFLSKLQIRIVIYFLKICFYAIFSSPHTTNIGLLQAMYILMCLQELVSTHFVMLQGKTEDHRARPQKSHNDERC